MGQLFLGGFAVVGKQTSMERIVSCVIDLLNVRVECFVVFFFFINTFEEWLG